MWKSVILHLEVILNTHGGRLYYTWKSFRLHLEVVWTTSGKHVDDIWKSFRLHLEVIWTTSGSHLDYIWRSCGLHLEVIGPRRIDIDMRFPTKSPEAWHKRGPADIEDPSIRF